MQNFSLLLIQHRRGRRVLTFCKTFSFSLSPLLRWAGYVLPNAPVIFFIFSYPTDFLKCQKWAQKSKRTIITRAEQSYGRVPLAGLCRLFISVYVPGAGLPGARASAFPSPHGSEICPDRAAYSAPAIDTHKAQCRWPWPFPPANTQWHWIPRP